MKNTIKIAFLAAFAVCATAYMTLVTIVIFPGNHVIRPVAAMAQNESEIEAVIVLGHSVNRENEPSQWLVGRLEVALELYNLGIAPVIIVSGGQGPTDSVSVALVMKDWLIENGIPSYAILKEENSRNTYENFKYSQILGRDTRHITNGSIIIATNDFHMFRSIRTANLFFEDVYAISAPTSAGFRKTLAILREPFSLIKLAFDHLMHN